MRFKYFRWSDVGENHVRKLVAEHSCSDYGGQEEKEKERLPGPYISSESIPIITCLPSVRSYLLEVWLSSSKTISWSPETFTGVEIKTSSVVFTKSRSPCGWFLCFWEENICSSVYLFWWLLLLLTLNSPLLVVPNFIENKKEWAFGDCSVD